jgi:hypothetical protein
LYSKSVYDNDAFVGKGNLKPEDAKLNQLEKELATVKEEQYMNNTLKNY